MGYYEDRARKIVVEAFSQKENLYRDIYLYVCGELEPEQQMHRDDYFEIYNKECAELAIEMAASDTSNSKSIFRFFKDTECDIDDFLDNPEIRKYPDIVYMYVYSIISNGRIGTLEDAEETAHEVGATHRDWRKKWSNDLIPLLATKQGKQSKYVRQKSTEGENREFLGADIINKEDLSEGMITYIEDDNGNVIVSFNKGPLKGKDILLSCKEFFSDDSIYEFTKVYKQENHETINNQIPELKGADFYKHQFLSYMDSHNIDYSIIDGRIWYDVTDFVSDLESASCCIDFDDLGFTVCAFSEVDANAETLDELLKYLFLANYWLRTCTFVINMKIGEILVKTRYDVDNSLKQIYSESYLRDCIFSSSNALDNYGDGIIAICNGSSDAVTAINDEGISIYEDATFIFE